MCGRSGRNLRATAVMEGSVARRSGQFKVIAQLIRTSDGYHLWSHTYDTTLADLPAVESGIAQATRNALTPSAAAGHDVSTTRNPEAHDLYMRAAYQFNIRTEASTRQAIALAQQATQLDPSFVQPYLTMAAGESQLNTLLAQSPHAGAERSLVYIEKALALDPQNSSAHGLKALIVYTDQWDWPQAEREFRLALAAGSHGSAENLYGWSLMTRGRFPEARRHLQIAAELDPLSLGPQLNQVSEFMDERNYPEAKRKDQEILQAAPTNLLAMYLASTIAYWEKDCPGATAWSEKLIAAYPKAYVARTSVRAANSVCGRPLDSNETEAAELKRENPSAYISPYSMAAAFAIGEDSDRAMAYLEKSAELREPVLNVRPGTSTRSFRVAQEGPRTLPRAGRRLGLIP